MRSSAKSYNQLRAYIETIPLVDCHDHANQCGPKPADPVSAIVDWYFRSDLISVSSDAEVEHIFNAEIPLEERWPVLERAWKRTCHTGYAQVARRVLKEIYGEDDLTLDALLHIRDRIPNIADEQVYESFLEKANIKVRLADVWPDVKAVMAGTFKLPPRSRLITSLWGMHNLRNYQAVQSNASPLGRTITCLDEYIDACWTIFKSMKEHGAVAFKDQSAYDRPIFFENPTRHQAEEAFNWIIEDPRRSLSYPDGVKPLGDYLFHAFMRMARDLDLPVQIHTGHMAGIRNDIVKTNAIQLTRLIELHRDTRFDIFHANWPYSGELLYLAKNFPNVSIDFCWANMIDPIYCQNLFKQALSSIPHGKLHAYGTDLGGDAITHAWGHADLARDNVAIALAEMVECEYITLHEANEIAYAWLFGNANAFFKLGL
jgi:hypothetical protein